MGDFSVSVLLFSIIGGLGLFIYGIRLMGDGLQKVAGQKMRQIIGYLTNNRFMGLGLGTVVTSVIQSSSATTVMVVGFVNAGLMTLVQAVPIIFGAEIGTTVTAQLIAFKLTDYALPVIGVGAALYLFGKKKNTRNIGESILGFGILFLGLSIMSTGVKPLGNSPIIKSAFTAFSHNPFLGVLVGVIVTAIIQSSSVTTGIILTLAGVGLLDIVGAVPIVLGANIGTCITAILASIGTNLSAKRAAISHVVFNTAGTVVALILMPFYVKIILYSSDNIMRQIANAHTLFNVVNAALFIGFVPLYVKFIKRIVPGKEVIVERGPKYLDNNLLNTPSIAIEAAKKEILRTLEFSKEMILTSMNVFNTKNRKDIQKVIAREDMVDELQTAIVAYLVKITEREISEREALAVPSLLHSINDIERIADHAVNIAEIAEREIDYGVKLSKTAEEEVKKAYDVVKEMLDDAIKAFPELDRTITKNIFRKEQRLNAMVVEFRRTHVKRLGNGVCNHLAGLAFIDILMNLEKIGDHITNVAQAIDGKLQWDIDDV